jgi:uncharacterized protein
MEGGDVSEDRVDQEQLLLDYLGAINRWDFDLMRQLFHPDISYEIPFAPAPFPRVTKGFDEVMAFLESVPACADAENLHDITVHAFADDANELVAEYESEMELVSGRPYANRYVVRATIVDGKLARFVEFFDPIPLIEALGGSVSVPDA